MSLRLNFTAYARKGGYFIDNDGFLQAKNPGQSLNLIERPFDDMAVREFYTVCEKLGTRDEDEYLIWFSNRWGPLMYNYEIDPERPIEASLQYETDPPRTFFKMLYDEIKNPAPEGFIINECKVVQIKVRGKIEPHLKPNNLFTCIQIQALFTADADIGTCQYRLEYGRPRKRTRGVCPADCMINTLRGKKKWGDGCLEAHRREKAKANNFEEPRLTREEWEEEFREEMAYDPEW